PMLRGQLWIRRMLSTQSLQAELSLNYPDVSSSSFNLHKQPKRQHIDHDFSLPKPPGLPALLINERREKPSASRIASIASGSATSVSSSRCCLIGDEDGRRFL